MSDINHILVVVSGDLAFSGEKSECIQVSIFLYKLKKAITQRYDVTDIQIVMVSGNHDVDYTKGSLTREELEVLEKEGNYNAFIQSELDKQEQFFLLSNRYSCFSTPGLLDQKTITY